MEIRELKANILAKNFDKFYIFVGEEQQVARVYIDKLSEMSGAQINFADSIMDVVNKPKSRLISLPTLYVIMDDAEFLKNEKAWAAIDRAIKDDIVVFWYTSQDKRNKFWKHFADRVVTFEKLDNRILKRHMNMLLSDANKDKLIEVCEGSYSRILLELDKLSNYQTYTWNLRDERERDGGQYWCNECLKTLLSDGTIYRPANDAIFDFVEAVLDRDVEDAYSLLEEAYECGEANMVLLSVLYTNFRNLLLYQTDKDNCGLSGWEKKNVSFAKGNYSDGELIHALRVLRKCEAGIKTGRMPDDISVHYFLVNVI